MQAKKTSIKSLKLQCLRSDDRDCNPSSISLHLTSGPVCRYIGHKQSTPTKNPSIIRQYLPQTVRKYSSYSTRNTTRHERNQCFFLNVRHHCPPLANQRITHTYWLEMHVNFIKWPLVLGLTVTPNHSLQSERTHTQEEKSRPIKCGGISDSHKTTTKRLTE